MVARVLEFQLQHQSSNEYSGLISFRLDGLDLLAVQGSLKSLLQHHSSKASILQCSTFFVVQLSHPYMTTRKTLVFNISHVSQKLIKAKSQEVVKSSLMRTVTDSGSSQKIHVFKESQVILG